MCFQSHAHERCRYGEREKGKGMEDGTGSNLSISVAAASQRCYRGFFRSSALKGLEFLGFFDLEVLG